MGKVYLLVCTVGALLVENVEYMGFVAKYGRDIKTADEWLKRYAAFAERDELIKDTNERTDINFKVGHNRFSDMLPNER
jgi:hypothetical protein